jgi:hypothetical protein
VVNAGREAPALFADNVADCADCNPRLGVAAVTRVTIEKATIFENSTRYVMYGYTDLAPKDTQPCVALDVR